MVYLVTTQDNLQNLGFVIISPSEAIDKMNS